MIVLDLCCDNEHLFEAWFADAAAFAHQKARGLVECPVCGSIRIERRPSAPYVNRSRTSPAKPAVDPAMIGAALRLAASRAEDVGERFPAEARRIHYGESDERSIRGRASGDELGELLEEGILVLPVPEEPDLQ